MSILSGILGLIEGNRAADAISTGYHDAMQGVVNANQGANTNVNAAGNQAIGTVDTATRNANEVLGAGLNRATEMTQPYVAAGGKGLGILEDMGGAPKFSWDPTTNVNDPAFQFRLKTGSEAIQNDAAARGLASSGNVLRDLTQFGTGAAAQYENEDFNRALSTFQTNRNNQFQLGTTLAGIGETGTNQFLTANNQFTQPTASNITNAGYFTGTTDVDIQKFLADLNAKAAVSGGNYRIGQAQGTAAKDLNTGNAVSSIAGGIPDLLTTLSSIFSSKGGG